MRKKFETTVHASGTVSVRQLGVVADTDIDTDIEREKDRFTRLALRPETAYQIKTVEITSNTVVAVYECGTVKIVHWVADPARL
jgi:hypothetical protein